MSDVTNTLPSDQAEKGADEMAKKTAAAAKPEVKETEVKKVAVKKAAVKPEIKKAETKKPEVKKTEVKKVEKKVEVKKAAVKPEVKKVEAKKPAEPKVKEPKVEKKSREKKIPLKIKAPKSVDVKETKYVVTATQGEKRMWMRGSSVGLTHKVTGFKAFKPVTEEDAKKNHLGKTRMLGKIATQDELNDLIAKYFGA